MSKKQKTSSVAEPWKEIQPYLLDTAAAGQGLFNSGQLAPKPFQSGATTRYIQDMASMGRNNPFTDATMANYSAFMDQGPYAGIDAVRGNIAKEVLPQVAGMFGQGGFANSTMAQQTAGEAMTQALAPFEYDQFNQGMQRQLQGLQLAPTMSGMQYADLSALKEAGAMRDQFVMDKRNQPAANVNAAAQLFGGLGGLGSTGSGSQSPSTLDTLGGLGQMGTSAYLAYLALCDRRLKTDIEPSGETFRGVPLHMFRYFFDAPDVRRIGPMADEVPAHARVLLPSGFLAVDMGAI